MIWIVVVVLASTLVEEELETVVTASRQPQADAEVTGSVSVIDKEQLDGDPAATLPEALDELPGVLMQSTNRGAGAPIIRGLIGPQTALYVDDVRFTLSTFRTGPNQYLATFDRFAVERVEVLRGPASVPYGSGAMGGVVRLFTGSARGQEHHGELRLFGQSADRTAGLAAELALEGRDTGFLVGFTGIHFGDLRAGGGSVQPGSAYASSGGRVKVQHELSERWRLTAASFFNSIDDAARMDRLGAGDVRSYDNDDLLSYFRVDREGSGVLDALTLTVSHHRSREQIRRYRCTSSALRACARFEPSFAGLRSTNEDTVNSFGFDGRVGLTPIARRLELQLGIDANLDRVASQAQSFSNGSPEPSRGLFSDGSRYRAGGVYFLGEAVVYDGGVETGQLVLSGGARVARFEAAASDVPGLGDVNYAFTGLSGSASVSYRFPGRGNIYGSVAQGFRAPNLQETTVLGDTGSTFEVPNAELEPERALSFELGARTRGEIFDGSVAVYRTQISDLIVREAATFNGDDEVGGAPVRRRVNADEGLLQGFEGELGMRYGSWRISASGSRIVGTVNGEGDRNEPLRRIPPAMGRAALAYTAPRFDAELWAQGALRQDRLGADDESDFRICETSLHSGQLDANCAGTPGFLTLNLKGRFRLDELSDLILALNNITDERYRWHGSGVPAAGVDGRLTYRLRF